MKRLLTLCTVVTMIALTAMAIPNFDKDKQYHIVCVPFPDGCVVDGATAGADTPIYYKSAATSAKATYWIFNEEEEGIYSIRNALTGKYVTYDGIRRDIDTDGELRRYVDMTDEMNGEYSLWQIDLKNNSYYYIRNVGQYDHVWDVRTDSYCVGTHSENDGSNQHFLFYDQDGNQVTEKPKEDVDPEPEPQPATGVDVSQWIGASAESADGWTFDNGEWTSPSGGNYHNGDSYLTIPFRECWHDSYLGPQEDRSMYRTIRNLAPGEYILQADIIAVRQSSRTWFGRQEEELGYGVFLFANEQSTEAGTYNEKPRRYQVKFTVGSDKTATIGVRIEGTNANWVAVDNFTLYFQGTQSQVLAAEKEIVRDLLSNYYSEEDVNKMMAEAGDDFDALEALRESVATLPAPDPLTRGAKDLTFDGRGMAYVESIDRYIYSMSLDNFGKDFTTTVNYIQKEGWEQVRIQGKAIAPGETVTFPAVKGERIYTITIPKSDGSETLSYKICFSSLPVVKIYGSFNNEYSEGNIIVFDPAQPQPDLINMKAKWRGGITNGSGKHKRNYHVKLKDANGEPLEKKFFGLRNDNSWILESCQVDMSRIRNRTLTDLWNDYCTPPYYKNKLSSSKQEKLKSGTRGQFVELVLNEEYRGIYCMTENMDRKQMQLMKIDEATEEKPEPVVHGQLWKSKDWSYAVFMGPNRGHYYPADFLTDPNENSEMWDKYQVKYPDFEDYGYKTEWDVLYNAVDFVCHSSDADFIHSFSEYFDMPVVIDYYILMETILSTDNHGKNMFFACYDKQKDKKITFGVWDMDATCGQRWSDNDFHSSLMQPEQDYATYVYNNEHGDYNVFKRLRDTDTDNFNMRVRKRYRDLRQNYLKTENILNRFRTYLDEFKTCGAAQREYDKWSYDSDVAGHELDFDNEMEYLEDWFTRRMDYLDKERFDIESLPVGGIELVKSTEMANQNAKGVYTVGGQLINRTGDTKGLPAGMYVVNGYKRLVK